MRVPKGHYSAEEKKILKRIRARELRAYKKAGVDPATDEEIEPGEVCAIHARPKPKTKACGKKPELG